MFLALKWSRLLLRERRRRRRNEKRREDGTKSEKKSGNRRVGAELRTRTATRATWRTASKTTKRNGRSTRSLRRSLTDKKTFGRPNRPNGEVRMQSVLLTAAILDVGIQFVGWALASVFKTEKFYDLFGSGTFALIAITSLLSKGTPGLKQFLLAVLILIWALRLGSFLVVRVLKTGGDKRFDGVKNNPGKFAVYWFLQAVWVYVTMLPTLFVMNATLTSKVLAWSDYIGLSLFLLGFGLESMSDLQKYKFKMDPENTGKFINSGKFVSCSSPVLRPLFKIFFSLSLF